LEGKKGILLALKRWNRIIEARYKEKECPVRTDCEIFDLFSFLMKGAKPRA